MDVRQVQEPVFLVGAERSGTTLLRLMLNHHPQITFTHEFEYALENIGAAGRWPDRVQYHEKLATHRVFLSADFKVDPHLSYPQLIQSFLAQQRDRQQKAIVGATLHWGFENVPYLWPKARYIHLYRDGRDVAQSCISMGWAGNVWTGVERWIHTETAWASFQPRLPAASYLELRYEDLIQDPATALSRICQFLKVPYRPEMLTYPQTTSYSRPNPQRIQRWKRQLSPYQVRLVEARIGPLLVERGYGLSGLPHLTLSPTHKLWLKVQDWLARQAFRLRFYGLGLILSDYVSRKLSLSFLQRWVKVKLNAIETAALQ